MSRRKLTFLVTDREYIEQGFLVKSAYALFSIRDPGKRKVRFRKASLLRDVLELAFRDAQPTERFKLSIHIRLINEKDEANIWTLVLGLSEEVKTLVVHWEQGESKSPAVASAICQELGDDPEFSFTTYRPDEAVFTVVRKAHGKNEQRVREERVPLVRVLPEDINPQGEQLMPLIIKVAVSRKLTEDFNSRGWSLDIQSELDPRTLDDTNQLADSSNYLFKLANDLLDQQVQDASQGHHSNGAGHNQNGTRDHGGNNRFQNNGAYSLPNNGNGQSNAHSNGGSPKGHNGRQERPVTQAQINAINKMAQRFDTSGDAIAGEDFNCKLSELTIKQASELIDRLKKGLESQGGQEVGR